MQLSGEPLEFVDSYPYLGLQITHDLSWRLLGEALVRRVQKTAYAIAGTLRKTARPSANPSASSWRAICAAQVAYGMPVFEPDPRLCHQLDQLLAVPLRRALRLPKHTSAVAVLSEFGLLSTEGLFGKAAL